MTKSKEYLIGKRQIGHTSIIGVAYLTLTYNKLFNYRVP